MKKIVDVDVNSIENGKVNLVEKNGAVIPTDSGEEKIVQPIEEKGTFTPDNRKDSFENEKEGGKINPIGKDETHNPSGSRKEKDSFENFNDQVDKGTQESVNPINHGKEKNVNIKI